MSNLPNKEFPSADDPIGTKYVRDGDGDLIVDRRDERESRLRNILVYSALGMLLMIAGLSVLSAVQQKNEADREEEETQYILFEHRQVERDYCEMQTNPLRAGLREFIDVEIKFIEDDIAENRKLPRDYFPSIPPDEFDALIEAGIAQLKLSIADLEALKQEKFERIDCADTYPLLDNPRTEADEEGT